MVLDIGKHSGPTSKCYVHHATLPNYIDNAHPPTKKDPFRTVSEKPFTHTLNIVVPSVNAQALSALLVSTDIKAFRYAKVYMKLHDLLTGSFFDEYIKTGDIVMLSEGRSGVDNAFSLVEGVLRLEIDKPTFERMGLEGKVIDGLGKKHGKGRYAVELNLRLPSMVRGKKGFERVLWAAKNVLDFAVTWLFHDINGSNDASGSIAAQSPVIRTVQPSIATLDDLSMPSISETLAEDDDQEVAELLEWITLITLRSSRVLKIDRIDPYLCRYEVPIAQQSAQAVTHFRWHGFIPSGIAVKLLLAALKVSGEDWLIMSGAGFDGSGYAVLKDKKLVTTWKYTD